MERDEAGLVGKPGFEFRRIHLESSIARYAGRVTQARELNRKAVDAALVRDEKETAAGFLADAALAEALAGNFAEARKQAREAVELANGKVVEGRSAVALALSREQDQARRLADDMNARFPQDTVVQYGFLPMIRCALALRAGDPKKAVEELVPAAPSEAGTYMVLYPAYLRGQALLAAGDGAGAAREFQKTLASPGVALDDLSGARLFDERRSAEREERLRRFPRLMERCRSGDRTPAPGGGRVYEAGVPLNVTWLLLARYQK
jgi:eukaryotic-like serine/threonine-protein kinase